MRGSIASAAVVLLGFGQSVSGLQSPTVGFILMGLGALGLGGALMSHERIRRWLPNVSFAGSDDSVFFSVHVRRPARWGLRRLRRRTQTLIHDWHRYTAEAARIHPDDEAEANEASERLFRERGDLLGTKLLLDQRIGERLDRGELALRERVVEVEAEYRRRGLLDVVTTFSPGELPSSQGWRPDSLGEAMRRLKDLADAL